MEEVERVKLFEERAVAVQTVVTEVAGLQEAFRNGQAQGETQGEANRRGGSERAKAAKLRLS